jgi:hypothetical protein
MYNMQKLRGSVVGYSDYLNVKNVLAAVNILKLLGYDFPKGTTKSEKSLNSGLYAENGHWSPLKMK